MSDIEIYYKAKKAGNVIIISKDSDMVDIINLRGAPPKLINIKFGNQPNRILYSALQRHIERALRYLTDFDNDVFQIEIEI
jgi:predicted nuclease of predicted toxin-antitoxin system